MRSMKRAAVALDGGADAGHFGQVDAGPDDHSSAPGVVMVRRPCLTPLVLIRASAMLLHVAGLAPHHQHLQAVVVVQMHVQRRKDVIVVKSCCMSVSFSFSRRT